MGSIDRAAAGDAVVVDDGPGWQTLGQGDLGVIGIITCVNTAVVLLSLHLWLHASWLPYKTRMPLLLLSTGVAVRVIDAEIQTVANV